MSSPGVIAITGLGSFLGRALVDRLLARSSGLRIVGLDKRRPFRLDERVNFHSVDLTEPTADSRVAEVLAQERVEAVVHTAFRAQPTANIEMDHELETIGRFSKAVAQVLVFGLFYAHRHTSNEEEPGEKKNKMEKFWINHS